MVMSIRTVKDNNLGECGNEWDMRNRATWRVGWEFGTVWMLRHRNNWRGESIKACCFYNKTFCQTLELDLLFQSPKFPLFCAQLSSYGQNSFIFCSEGSKPEMTTLIAVS